MPITADEKAALDDALNALDPIDSVCIAHLLYDMLLDAKLGSHNGNGMGWKACSTLGRLIKDKTPWDSIQPIEAAVEVSIRMPLVKSTDTVFRSRFATTPPRLAEEHRQTLAHVFGKMDGSELVNLTKLLYNTISNIEFPDQNALDAFGKFYYSGYTWDELNRSPPIKQSILVPFVNAAHNYFRETLSGVFIVFVPEQVALPASEEEPPAELPAVNEESVSPTAPMPLPEFASAEEIAERAARDAEKPRFKGGRENDGKKKKNRNGRRHKDEKVSVDSVSSYPHKMDEIKAPAEEPSEEMSGDSDDEEQHHEEVIASTSPPAKDKEATT